MSEQTTSKVPQIRFKGFDEDWAVATVSDFVLSLDAGVSVNSGDRAANSAEFGILKTSAVTNGVFEADENKVVLTVSEQSRLKESVSGGTIIISRMNTPALVGANAYVESNHENLFLPDRLWAAKPRDGISMRFLASILGSEKGRDALSKLAKGTSGSMKNITKPDVLAVSVMAPSPLEQTQIGEYFRELDSLIGLHRHKHDKLVTLKKAMLQKMFPQPGATTPEIRFKGFSGKWKVEPVSSLLTERNIQAPKSDQYPLMAFIAGQGVAPKGKRYNREFLVSDEANKKYKQTELGDFIYSSNNLETGSIGINKFGSASISPVYSIFSPTQDGDPDFIGQLLCQKPFVSEMVKWRQGVVYGQWRIHESDFLRIEATFPFVDEQKKIGTYFRTLDELISKHAIQLQKLQQIKSACLERMFV